MAETKTDILKVLKVGADLKNFAIKLKSFFSKLVILALKQ